MVRDQVAEYLRLSTMRAWLGDTITLVTDFESFIEWKINRTGVRWEVLLVLIIGALGSVGMYYVAQVMVDASNLNEMQFVAIGRTIRPALSIFLLWALYTILFYFVGNFLGGYGHARRLVKGIAWAFIPIGIANALRSIALWWTFQDMDVKDHFQGFKPIDHFESAFVVGLEEPTMMFAMAIFVICLLWSAYLMTYVLQYGKSMDRQTAIRVVAIPYLIHIVWIVWTLYQGNVSWSLML